MSGGGLSRSDPGTKPFNPLFVVYLIIAAALTIFFLLYFNRAFASLVSYGVRTWTWHRYRVYVDVQALQISLLGGRIFFTGLRYHGNNETFLVQNGHITWRYWYRRVRQADIFAKTEADGPAGDDATNTANGKNEDLPCRISVSLVGLEWFVYNRSAAYESILASLTDENQPDILSPRKEEARARLRKRGSKNLRRSEDGASGDLPLENDATEEKTGEGGQIHSVSSDSPANSQGSDSGSTDEITEEPDLPFMLQLFPISVKCDKAAVVMGNENTKAVLIVKAELLSGVIDASETPTPDPYRQVFKIRFKHPIVEMKDNVDYMEDQASRATREKQIAKEAETLPKKSFFRRQRRRVLGQLRDIVPYWRRSVESFSTDSRSALGTAASHIPGVTQWRGLSRYIDERDQDDQARWLLVEYAAVSTVIDSPEATLTVFWDAPGKVGSAPVDPRKEKQTSAVNINGEEPPAWGIALAVNGGVVNYGPWADRQRAELQRVFFPSICKDATPAKPLLAGADRTSTQFKLYVQLDDAVTVRIPIREESKNWKWKGKQPSQGQSRSLPKRKPRARSKKSKSGEAVQLRPAGWLELKVPGNSSVSYSMDMVASSSGFSNTLDVDFPSTELSSSVNHEMLWRSGRQQIRCDLSTPLGWNALRSWRFHISGDKTELFILREHIFLLIDLVDDWASGPPPEYLVFTPFRYYMNLELRNLKLYLNVNDGNVINKPTDLSDNTYLILSSPALASTACIPIDKYRPSKNTIPFDVRAETISVSLHVPPWNTQKSFLTSTEIGQGENLLIDGHYHYNATTSTSNTDTLVLSVTGQSVAVHLYGFIIRYFLKVKDNYFGDDIHFKTLEEHQELLQLRTSNPSAQLANRPPHKKSNDLDVIISVRVDDPKVLLPANLYSSKRYVQLEAPSLSADLRFTNYYMDMDFVISPLSLSLSSAEDRVQTPTSATSSTQLFIDGIHVYGHRLFGLPPTEPTYMCNWDLSVGDVTGECTAEFLETVISGGKGFLFTFDDDENALISYSSIVFYDITFLRAFVRSSRLWIHVDEAAFLVSTGSVSVHYNDWARSHYSKRVNIEIPDVQISCVNGESASRHKSRPHQPVETDALLKTSIRLAIIGRKYDFTHERKLQQELVRREDQRTHRADFLLLPDLLDDLIPDSFDPPAQSVPPVPLPASMEDVLDDQESTSTSMAPSDRSQSGGIRHTSSFLSLSSSANSSIVRPRSSMRSNSRSHHGDSHPNSHKRGISVSTGRHSAFHSAVGDFEPHRFHSSVAFSSQYFAPHFPLESVQPNTRDTVLQSLEDGDEETAVDSADFVLEDVDPDSLEEEYGHSSTILELSRGITMVVNPVAVRSIASLLSALQPRDPEDILDSLQVDSMTEISDLKKLVKVKGKVNDLAIRIPSANIRLVNVSTVGSPEPSRDEEDHYDLAVSRVALSTRTVSTWDDPFKPETKHARTSLQLRLGSVEATASEHLQAMEDTQAAVIVQAEHIMVSLGSKDIRYLDMGIGSINAQTGPGRIEYLSALIHRTTTMATDLSKMLAETTSQGEDRSKYFIHCLLTGGRTVGDPAFLVRPSAVLRSALEHLRTFDSWKLAMRLRQIWSTMGLEEKEQLRLDCLGTPKGPQIEARQVIAAFQGWRSWDLEDLTESILLKNIFGSFKELGHVEPSDELPLLAAFKLGHAEFSLDRGSGPKQNTVAFVDLTARTEKHTNETDRTMDVEDVEGILTVLSVYCGESRVTLNWDLCELVDDVLALYNRSQKKSDEDTASRSTDPEQPSDTPEEDPQALHVLIELGRGSVELDTINLSTKSLSNGLKTSLLLNVRQGKTTATNLILNCDAVTSRLHNHSELIGMAQLREPSIFFSHELEETDDVSYNTIKAAASSHSLTLAVKQDPVVLTELLATILQDEIAQLYQLKDHFPSSPVPDKPRKKIVERLSAYRVNVAMFLDQYDISVPLLRSMTYNISGVEARAAIAANAGKEIWFDFDINENSHDIQMQLKDGTRSISVLRIPPTNGRVTSRMGQSEHFVEVYASVEKAKLDASAVYSLLLTANRPQISRTLEDLQEQTKVVQGRIADLFGSQTPVKVQPEPPAPKPNLVYTVHLALAGMEVFGTTQLKSEAEPLAQLSFSVDMVHLVASNRIENKGPILAYPELHVHIHQIMFDIQRGREDAMRSCGSLALGALLSASSQLAADGTEERSISFKSNALQIILSPETISTFVDVIGYMGDKIKDLDTSREMEYLRKLRQSKPRIAINDEEESEEEDIIDSFLSTIVYHIELRNLKIGWLVADIGDGPTAGKEDLELSIALIEFGTRRTKSARLTIEDFQLQMIPPGQDRKLRSHHSALLPEVVFNVAYISTAHARRLAFQAVGKSLDLRLTSGFIIPAANLNDSIMLSFKNVQRASQHWNTNAGTASVAKLADTPQQSLLGRKRMESLLVGAEFAGAVVYVSGKKVDAEQSRRGRSAAGGKYGQFTTDESGSSALLKSPGLTWKFEYRDNGKEDPSLYGEIKIDGSSNELVPSVVPLILDMMASVKEVVKDDEDDGDDQPKPAPTLMKSRSTAEDNILTADPSAVLGRLKLNLGLRICKQEFSLSCQPIARVAAKASFEDVYFTLNTIRTVDHGNFFAISGAVTNFDASVQHVYSRESTGSFKIQSIVMSLMNSKHVSGTSGVSAILKVSPMEILINAKQMQDFLLFREIWYPEELRQGTAAPVAKLVAETSQAHLVQRYQQVAATAAFPWTATISIASLEINVDLGQAIGKSVFAINEFWISSKKTSDWEQNLCLGFERIGIDCTGRLSGFMALQKFQLRTSIQWPEREAALNETPLIQASIGFNQFRMKTAFDYQAFLVADITSLVFLMYNVRRSLEGGADRLVASFEGEAVQVFGTTTSAAQGIALYQAVQKLIQERRESFETSLREIERFTRRPSVLRGSVSQLIPSLPKVPEEDTLSKSPISLDTDVVVTLRALNLGVFPSTFSDHQVFKMEALNAQARFAASIEHRRIHSVLGLTLGQLRIGLAGVRNIEAPKALSEISVEDVVARATGSRGGTILKVPEVQAVMQTWQAPEGKRIDYIFKSEFEGKVEVGWNYSRVSYIRGMWANHAKTLEATWGRELAPLTAIRVTGVPEGSGGGSGGGGGGGGHDRGDEGREQQKITAEVTVPQSRYEYVALEPPVIETPQLRDMGEATPPLEWIGLHRERLPNLVHQIVIVALLELAGEVEDAYERILGSS